MGANENPRSDRGVGLAVGVAFATAALVWLVVEFRLRAAGDAPVASERELRSQVAALERRVLELEAAQRTLASLATLREPRAAKPQPDADVVARAAQASAGALASKPLEMDGPDSAERARRVGDESLARALDRASALPDFDAPSTKAAPSPLVIDSTSGDAKRDEAASLAAADPDAKPDSATAIAKRDADVIAAFNQLLRDAGLVGWKLISAQPQPEEHCLGTVVLARLGLHGTAIGSLTAKRLLLQRDAVTGVAGIELTGAKGSEGGIDEAYENGTTRLEVPGILPLDLLAPCLRELFGVGTLDTTSALVTGDQVTRAVNRILSQEKGVSMRIRSVDRLEEQTLRKAVIDLAFDEHGEPSQTVLADSAWFEVDASARYGELRCEGGDMVEKGLRRPLYRGKLRVPLLDIKPEQWQGMPAARAVTGS